MVRECGQCTKCCEGYLSIDEPSYGVVVGIIANKRTPCQWLNRGGEKGCFTYDFRPPVCHEYQCEWKTNLTLPDSMSPHLSNLIITERKKAGVRFYDVVYTGHTIPEESIESLNKWLTLPYCIRATG